MKQSLAFEILKTGRNVFLTGAPGSGKTFLINKYIKYLREHSIPVALTASTGIAATHISGQTIHSFSGMGRKEYLNEWDIDEILQREYIVSQMRKISVLVIDEISMLSATFLDSLNALMKAARQDARPFGGVQIVMVGDFFQLPPVSRDFSYAFESVAWQEADLKIIYLKDQYRQSDELNKVLDAMRSSSVSAQDLEKIHSRITQDIPKDTTILYTHNKDVDELNLRYLQDIKSALFEFPRELHGNKAKAEAFARHLLSPEILQLKIGAKVMFTKNDPKQRYVNGTLAEIVDFSYSKAPIVKTISGDIINVEKAVWNIENEKGVSIASVEQYPLRLAWAITVHKSQGMSLDRAYIDLRKTFVPGQGYVALSRVRSLSGLFLKGLNEKALELDRRVLSQDSKFQRQSLNLEKIFSAFSDEKVSKMQEEFLLKNSNKAKKDKKPKSFELTLQALESVSSIKDLANERGLSQDTVIKHLETAQNEGFGFDISHLQDVSLIGADTIKELEKAFDSMGDSSLKKIKEEFNLDLDYKTLRLVRLLRRLDKNRTSV